MAKNEVNNPPQKQTPWNKGETGVYSEATLQKMSAGRKGKLHSKEAKQKISSFQNGTLKAKDIQRQKEIQEFYPEFEFRRIRESQSTGV